MTNNAATDRLQKIWRWSGLNSLKENFNTGIMLRYTILFVAFLAMPVIAEDDAPQAGIFEHRGGDIFELGDFCRSPVSFSVADVSEDAKEIGLTREAIETVVRNHLHGAQIYAPLTGLSASTPYLEIRIHVAGEAFVILFQYTKRASISVPVGKYLEDSQFYGRAITWQHILAETHDDSSRYILQNLRDVTVKFIDEYLRVNRTVCDLGNPWNF